jgi:hypothetical protein
MLWNLEFNGDPLTVCNKTTSWDEVGEELFDLYATRLGFESLVAMKVGVQSYGLRHS